MRALTLTLAGLALLVAGCATNRMADSEIAPSQLAAQMNIDSGWSVPPGQRQVTDPPPGAAIGPEGAEDPSQPAGDSAGETHRSTRKGARRGVAGPSDAAPGYAASSGPYRPRSGPSMAQGPQGMTRSAQRAPAGGFNGVPVAPLAPVSPGNEQQPPTRDAPQTAAPGQRISGEAAPPRPTRRAPPQRVAPLVPAFPVKARTETSEGMHTVNFGFDQSELGEDARGLLERNLQWLKDHPNAKVRIEGHADERGTSEYNLALGARRARRVREYLVHRGIAPERMVIISFGEEMPLEAGQDEQSWGRNRRAEFRAIEGGRMTAKTGQP